MVERSSLIPLSEFTNTSLGRKALDLVLVHLRKGGDDDQVAHRRAPSR
jgi:hypothetical protein